jgi:hypothetical protein
MNYKVAQEYPGSKNNTITAKTVLTNRTFAGSLQGDWKVVLNGKTVASIKVTDSASMNEVNGLFDTLCDTYQLTGVCNSTRNIQKF